MLNLNPDAKLRDIDFFKFPDGPYDARIENGDFPAPKTVMDQQAQAIIDRKHEAGDDAYLWVHDSGDIILWPSENASEGDDGAHAIARWSVSAETVDALVDSGEVDEIG